MVEISDEELAAFPEGRVDQMGKTLGDAMKRRRNEFICVRDGHEPNMDAPPATQGLICTRCKSVLDEPRYEALKAAGRG